MNDMNIDAQNAIYQSRYKNLVEDWHDRIDLVEDVNETELPYDRKMVLAQCLQNTVEAMNLAEATDAKDVSGFKHFALDLVTAVIPNLVANEIVSVQPINKMVA